MYQARKKTIRKKTEEEEPEAWESPQATTNVYKEKQEKQASFQIPNGGNETLRGKEVNSMPRNDGTGPMGMGPRTGGGFGRCGKNAATDTTVQNGAGRGGSPQGGGRGRCFGGGRGAGRHGFAAQAITPEQETATLGSQIADISRRLTALEKQD